ncbi:MAG: winged helix-turn-helix domain-containing protein [Gemmatimonadaceae bacterium]|nr:winged helix-turn-helix domain-containing protein [Gemmatimonadaceae bacterium]
MRHFASREEFDAFAERLYAEHSYRFGDWSFNWVILEVRDGERRMRITERQGDILRILLDAAPEPVRPSQIARLVSEAQAYEFDVAGVKVFIRRLRRRLGRERIVTTLTGYAFVPFVGIPAVAR